MQRPRRKIVEESFIFVPSIPQVLNTTILLKPSLYLKSVLLSDLLKLKHFGLYNFFFLENYNSIKR